jgi:glucose/mannose transport system permease protein
VIIGSLHVFFPMMVLPLVSALSKIDPRIEDAARTLGANAWRIFRKIILPLSPPILIVTVIWQFTGIWNEFLYGVVLTTGKTQPVTAAVVAFSNQQQNVREYNIISSGTLIAALPPLLVYFFGGKYFVRGLTQGAIK